MEKYLNKSCLCVAEVSDESDRDPNDRELPSASEDSSDSSDSSSDEEEESGDEKMESAPEPAAAPETSAPPDTRRKSGEKRALTPTGVRVFKIPKRRRTEDSPPYKHASPLNRTYPNVVYGSNQYRRRRDFRPARNADGPRNDKFKRGGWKDKRGGAWGHQATAPLPANLRTDSANVKRSLLKMKIPQSMIRPPGCRPFGQWLMPEPSECTKFISASPPESKMKPEKFTDSLVRRCTEWGLMSSNLQDKSIVCGHVISHFNNMQCFTQTTVNKAVWNCIRKETMMTTGLVTLCAFADEMLFWLQANMDKGVQWKLCRDDVIMSTAPEMCSQALFKIRGMVACFLEDKPQQALVRQVCYLMCSGDRLPEAAALLQELRFDFQFGLLVLLLVTPYAFLYSQSVPQCEFGSYFARCVKEYRPGSVMGLLNSIVKKHVETCHSKTCANNVTCILSPGHSNKGLFFFPLPNKV